MKRLASLALVALAGCVVAPPASDSLDQARGAYSAAQADPQVRTYASAELDAAGRSLNDAERLAREGAAPEEVAHQAYLAEQRARIARETAQTRANEAEIAKAGAERERVMSEARSREAQARSREAEARLREAEAERDRALARAKAAEESRLIAESARSTQVLANEQLTSDVRRLEAQLRDLQAKQTQHGWIITLGSDVLFDVGRASLKPGGRRAVENVARIMRESPERNIVIEGFTDNSGSEDANQRLSDRRAHAVRNALIASGVAPERILARGLGAAYPVASNTNAAGRQLNRRVEILIADTPGRAATGGSALDRR
jgi:outer membrane protein OmpA-like peptidoglycan-associated protein